MGWLRNVWQPRAKRQELRKTENNYRKKKKKKGGHGGKKKSLGLGGKRNGRQLLQKKEWPFPGRKKGVDGKNKKKKYKVGKNPDTGKCGQNIRELNKEPEQTTFHWRKRFWWEKGEKKDESRKNPKDVRYMGQGDKKNSLGGPVGEGKKKKTFGRGPQKKNCRRRKWEKNTFGSGKKVILGAAALNRRRRQHFRTTIKKAEPGTTKKQQADQRER